MFGFRRPAGLPTLREEVADFLRYVMRPRPGPRMAPRRLGSGLRVDFALNAPGWRLVQWAALLWLVNVFVFAPLALSAADAGGAQHRLNVHALPWLTALIWAPIVEELTFRYALRRPALLWWFVPLGAAALVWGPGFGTVALVVAAVLLALAPLWYPADHAWRPGWALSWPQRRWTVRLYPVLFHAAAVAFAAVHLFNFRMTAMSLLLLPLLVLPQWVTGLVLGWMRVRRGIGAAMALHAIFNGGPLLLVALILRYAPELAVSG